MILRIKGNPTALKRHRMTKTGHSYDPSAKEKQEFLMMVQNKAPNPPIKGAIKIDVLFYMPRPKSHYRTGKFSGILKDTAPMWHTGRPDLDNLVKFISDALNGVFYKDDSQICLLHAEKMYVKKYPRTEIDIEEIHG